MMRFKLLPALAAGAMLFAANFASAAELIVKLEGFAEDFVVGTTYTAPNKFILVDSAVVPDPVVSILTNKVKNDDIGVTTNAGAIGELLGGKLTIDLTGTSPVLVPNFLTVKAGTFSGDVFAFSATAVNRVFEIVFDVAFGSNPSGISNIQILTPIPAALPLLLTAIGGLFGFRWLRRRQQEGGLATA
jgi:hypothetical protein